MAVVTITITDDNEGGCVMQARSEPEVPENDDEATPAQVSGAMVMKLMEAIRDQALVELDEEGKGE